RIAMHDEHGLRPAEWLPGWRFVVSLSCAAPSAALPVACAFGLEVHALEEGFLSSNAGGREAGVEIGARDGLPLGDSLGEKDRETADEGIARTRRIDRGHRIGGDVHRAALICEQRTARTQSHIHLAEALRHER